MHESEKIVYAKFQEPETYSENGRHIFMVLNAFTTDNYQIYLSGDVIRQLEGIFGKSVSDWPPPARLAISLPDIKVVDFLPEGIENGIYIFDKEDKELKGRTWRKRLRIKFDLFSPYPLSKPIIMPYAVHPMHSKIVAGEYLSKLRTTERKVRIFFCQWWARNSGTSMRRDDGSNFSDLEGREYNLIKSIKVYGERNTGTQYVSRLIRRNFLCETIPGTLADAAPGHREALEEDIKSKTLDEVKRLLMRQAKIDDYFIGNLWATLGWKHAVPPTEIITAHPNRHQILFITVLKNPYAWALSLFRRPYEYMGIKAPQDFTAFISEPWVTVERENTPRVLESPIELWNLKANGYNHLAQCATVLAVRYEDILTDPQQFLDNVNTYLPKRKESFDFVMEATKGADKDTKDSAYYRDYYLNERWREEISTEQIEIINQFLVPSVVNAAGYKMIS